MGQDPDTCALHHQAVEWRLLGQGGLWASRPVCRAGVAVGSVTPGQMCLPTVLPQNHGSGPQSLGFLLLVEWSALSFSLVLLCLEPCDKFLPFKWGSSRKERRSEPSHGGRWCDSWTLMQERDCATPRGGWEATRGCHGGSSECWGSLWGPGVMVGPGGSPWRLGGRSVPVNACDSGGSRDPVGIAGFESRLAWLPVWLLQLVLTSLRGSDLPYHESGNHAAHAQVRAGEGGSVCALSSPHFLRKVLLPHLQQEPRLPPDSRPQS